MNNDLTTGWGIWGVLLSTVLRSINKRQETKRTNIETLLVLVNTANSSFLHCQIHLKIK